MNQKALRRINERLAALEDRVFRNTKTESSTPKNPIRVSDLPDLDQISYLQKAQIGVVLAMITGGNNLEAIKIVREQTHWGLAESKAMVDAMAQGLIEVKKMR